MSNIGLKKLKEEIDEEIKVLNQASETPFLFRLEELGAQLIKIGKLIKSYDSLFMEDFNKKVGELLHPINDNLERK